MRVQTIIEEPVTSFPEKLEPGVLYVSERFSSASHLCACGCGREVITPLSEAQWRITRDVDGAISVRPSIGSWVLPCKSHYHIDHGRIRWAKGFTDEQVAANQASDARALQRRSIKQPWWVRLKQWLFR